MSEIGGLGRRRFLQIGMGVAASSALAGAAGAQYLATSVTPIIQTNAGPVLGVVEDGVSTFRGLRYGTAAGGAVALHAATPTGTLVEAGNGTLYGPPRDAARHFRGGGA